MHYERIAIIGGTGFVGQHLLSELARERYKLRLLSRRRERKRALLVLPTLEQVETDVHSPSALGAALDGCDAVINLCGVLNDSADRKGSFDAVHVELIDTVAEAMRASGVRRLLHMSALNAAEDAPSAYLRSKYRGQQAALALQAQGIDVTCFAPSVICGRNDSFLNRFAQLLAISPGILPLACPAARFSPVSVGDVARAFSQALTDPETFGKIYQLCGPRSYTLREIVELIMRLSGHHRLVVGLGPWLSKLQAHAMEWVPGKPFSVDNYLSLQIDSVCTQNGFEELGIEPASLEAVAPAVLGEANRNALLTELRRSARG